MMPPAGSSYDHSAPDISPNGTSVLFGAGGALSSGNLISLSAETCARIRNKWATTPWCGRFHHGRLSGSKPSADEGAAPMALLRWIVPLRAPSRGGSWSDTGTILIWAGSYCQFLPRVSRTAVIVTPAGPCLLRSSCRAATISCASPLLLMAASGTCLSPPCVAESRRSCAARAPRHTRHLHARRGRPLALRPE